MIHHPFAISIPSVAAILLLASAPLGPPGATAPAIDEAKPGAADVGDAYFPGAGNGGYDVAHYDVTLDVEVEKGSVEAVVVIEATATQSLSSFHLDLVGLDVGAVHVGETEAKFTREGRELVVTPAKPIAKGATFSVRVAYSGEPGPVKDPSVAGMPIPGTGWFHRKSGIYVLSECVGAAGWLPGNDHPSDKATFSFHVTVPEPYVVAANGLLVEETRHEGKRTFHWKASDPMSTYLATIDIAKFEVVVEEGPGGIPVRLYHPIGAKERELAPFAKTVEMLEFFAERFGPYPFESVGAVLSYEFLGGALETQTIPVYSRGSGTSTVAHELAHQWFGDCVGPAEWKHMWLNEGFAVYAEWMWRARDEAPEDLDRIARSSYRRALRRKTGSPADPGVRHLFSSRTYTRGALALHALRREVGGETFFEILRSWVEENHDGVVTTEQFAAHCEKVAERDLEQLFANWVYGAVVPDVPEWN